MEMFFVTISSRSLINEMHHFYFLALSVCVFPFVEKIGLELCLSKVVCCFARCTATYDKKMLMFSVFRCNRRVIVVESRADDD